MYSRLSEIQYQNPALIVGLGYQEMSDTVVRRFLFGSFTSDTVLILFLGGFIQAPVRPRLLEASHIKVISSLRLHFFAIHPLLWLHPRHCATAEHQSYLFTPSPFLRHSPPPLASSP